MDRLEAMSILVAAIEAGSLSAGARRLGMPLATVSRKVSELERHLHTRLLKRSSRRLSLTDAGESYVAAARGILDAVEEAERGASGEYRAPQGELVVSAPILFGRLHLLPVAVQFLEAYPDIDMRFVFLDRFVNPLEERVDLAVRIGEMPDSTLVAIRVGSIRRIVCASPRYLAKRGTPKTPSELREHDCVTFDGFAGSGNWSFGTAKKAEGVAIRSRLVVNTPEAAVDAAVAGLGLTRVLSYHAALAMRAGALEVALREFEPDPWQVSLVYAGGRFLPLKVRAFIDFAAPRIKAALAGGLRAA